MIIILEMSMFQLHLVNPNLFAIIVIVSEIIIFQFDEINLFAIIVIGSEIFNLMRSIYLQARLHSELGGGAWCPRSLEIE